MEPQKKLVNCDLPSMFKVLEKLDLMSKREVDCICLSLKPVYNTLLVINSLLNFCYFLQNHEIKELDNVAAYNTCIYSIVATSTTMLQVLSTV